MKLLTLNYNRISLREVEQKIAQPSVILLDIDGTVVGDGDDSVSAEVIAIVEQWKQQHRVVLVSNSRRRERCRAIAQQLGVEYMQSKYKKPNIKVLDGLPAVSLSNPLVVIGDKVMTDTRFAARLDAQFIYVERLVSSHDRLSITLSYWFDDFCSWMLQKLSK